MPERPVNPTDEDNIRAWIEAYKQDEQYALPARVQFYYAETQEADLVPVVKHSVPQPDGSYVYEDLPVLPHVPIIHPRTANAFIHLPIAAGDFVLVICTSPCAEFWRAGDGSPQYPGDQARNHLQNAVALPGLFPLGNRQGSSPARNWPLPIASDNKRHLVAQVQNDTAVARFTLRDNGDALIETTGTTHLAGTAGEALMARADRADAQIAELRAAINSHVHAGVFGGLDSTAPATPPVAFTAPSSAADRVKGV